MLAAGVEAALTVGAPQGTFGTVTIGLLGSPSTGPVTGGIVVGGIVGEDIPAAPAVALPETPPPLIPALGEGCIPELPPVVLGFVGIVGEPAADGCVIDVLPAAC